LAVDGGSSFFRFKKEFKGIFSGKSLNQVVQNLADYIQDFSFITELLENNLETSDKNLINTLMEIGKSICVCRTWRGRT
jgi:hypothetical protein